MTPCQEKVNSHYGRSYYHRGDISYGRTFDIDAVIPEGALWNLWFLIQE